MAKDLNQCNFIGRLGRDPEVRYLQSGTPVAQFSIAVGDKWKDKNGDVQESTEWVNIEAWGKLAEICEQYLAKGDRVFISGAMKTQTWEDQDGNTKHKTIITVKDFQFLQTKGSEDGHQKNGGSSKSTGKNASGSGGAKKSYQSDDDIPF